MNACVSIFNQEGKKTRSFGSKKSSPGQRDSPTGLAVTFDNCILAADQANHRIQMFTIEGRLVKQIGQGGNGCVEFSFPTSVQVHPTGKIYSCSPGQRLYSAPSQQF